MQRYVGNLLLENFRDVKIDSTIQNYRLPIIEENFRTLARYVQNEKGCHQALYTSRIEFQFPGWDLKQCSSTAAMFCSSHNVPGLRDVQDQNIGPQPGPLPPSSSPDGARDTSSHLARSKIRADQILSLLQGYHVKIYAIPVDQMMTGLLDTLGSLRDTISQPEDAIPWRATIAAIHWCQ